jgi:raffinose/stachyose/melibiose transport system permease protein
MSKEKVVRKPVEKIKPGQIVLFVVTILLAILFLYPVFFALISAFKSNGDILKNPIALPTFFYTQNFKDLFAQSDFATAILHSVFLTVVSEVLIVCIVPMAAYGIERRKSKTTSLIYTYFLAGMMIPFHLYMFPLFKEMKVFHIFGNMVGPIVCYISGSIAFGTLLYCSFLKGIPLEIEEAAQIDGCTPFQTFWKVTFPLLGPCTGSMVILNGLGIWNDYLMPYLALPSGKAKTITVEIASFVGQYTARWDIVFAGTVISIVPALIIFCMFQKYFVKGITAGAAKG